MKIRIIGLIFLFALCHPRVVSGTPLFSVGSEFKYNYETLVTTGSEEPISHASAYKIKGFLHVSAVSSTTLSVELSDLTYGLYNGPWSYFPIPEMNYKSSPDLAPLVEPFHITIENGKVKAIIMDDQEPEWASNMKRGLATYLQIDFQGINFNEITITNKKELTTMGECNTKYEVLPGTSTLNKLMRVNKFRNHAVDCPDVPTRTRYATHIFYPCTDSNTRDIMNSTAYSTYDIELSKDGQPLLKQLTLFSSILYWPFTSSGPYQFSWINMTLSLDSVSRIGNTNFPPPPNAETHEDLSYVFEQSDPNIDPEDENPELTNEVIFFHHVRVDSDPETYTSIVQTVKEVIKEIADSLSNTESYFMDTKKFHANSPFSLILNIASLDYVNLKQLYTEYSSNASDAIKLQIFLDGLIMAGTTPSTLVIRDVLLTSTDESVLSRLAPSLPHFIRNPTEALAKEMDTLLAFTENAKIDALIRRTVSFSLASLIGRCCRKTNCTSSGLLDKYINYFENKLTSSTDFDERTVGLLGLRNLRVGKSLDKVLDIATGKLIYESPLRVQAIWSLRSLVHSDSERLMGNLLPVFYNRSESCELRTTVFGFLMSVAPDEKLLHDIAYYMWSETCPMVSNIVRSHLINAMNSKSPCGSPLKTYARTILRYLPPGEIDPLKTTNYALDYYDKNSGFGHQIYSTIQKSGKTSFPVSIYLGLNNYIGGYGSSYFGVFIRMEGLEKAITDKLVSMRSTNVDEIRNILTKIGVTQRRSSPLYLELTIVYHDYALYHFAADEHSVHKIPTFLKKLGEMSDATSINYQRSMILGGIYQEMPLEIGTPVSIIAGVTGIGSFSSNITRTHGSGMYSQDTHMKLQYNLFGLSRIANHAPGLGTMHSITSYRGLRLVVPRHFNVGADLRNSAINLLVVPSTEDDPVLAMAHGTSIVSLNYDAPTRVKDNLALEKLQASCSSCTTDVIVSRGSQYRKSRTLPFNLPSGIRGMIGEIKYFDCERDHSRTTVLKKFRNLFREDNQYAGIYDSTLAKLFLSLSHARDYIFIAPHAETCGIYARISQNKSGNIQLDRIEGQSKGGMTFRDTSTGQENYTANFLAKLDLNYTGYIRNIHPHKVSVTRLKLHVDIKERSIETQTVNLKLQSNDELSSQHGVICIKMDTSANRLPKDLLSYEGENEPKVEQRIRMTMGRVVKEVTNQDDPPCSDNYASFDFTAHATQSPEQKLEANSNIYPYSQCRAEKGSGDYPGNFVPPSAACYAAAWEQTNLRTGNITIKYKVAEEVQKRWQRPVEILAGFLYPYSSSSSNTGNTSHDLSSEVKYYEGIVDLNINVKKDSPIMDLHFRDITHSKEESFNEIDLGILPSIFQPKPVPARMSPLWSVGFNTGIVSHCSITPASVNTLDGFKYSAALRDCWTLLSGDCGKNAQYVILGKKISSEKIGLLVHFGENKVEFDGDSNPIIDGTKESLEDKKLFFTDSPTPLPFDVFRNGNEAYVISRMLGIYIRYTGHFATITLGSRYRGVHCGLCGHFDASFYNDLLGPDSSCPNLLQPNEMMNGYVVKEGNCAKIGNQCPSTA